MRGGREGGRGDSAGGSEIRRLNKSYSLHAFMYCHEEEKQQQE